VILSESAALGNGRFPIRAKGGVQISTPPHTKNGSTQATVLRAFDSTVFLSRFAANSLATAFWSFSASTR